MTIPEHFDHLIVGTPDLASAIDELERHVGVRARLGGSHPTLGTMNALIDLTHGYLELIAPDPENPVPAVAFGLDTLRETRIVGWALHTADLDAAVSDARDAGFDFGEALALSRRTRDGATLAWRSTWMRPRDSILFPILIEWAPGASPLDPHESPSCSLQSLRFHDSHAPELDQVLCVFGSGADVEAADSARIQARITGPGGSFDFEGTDGDART